MKGLFRFLAASLLALAALVPQARAASGYDLTDMWWNPLESGWGVEFMQQRDVVVAVIYVHGSDSRPVWYTGALSFQGLEAQTHEITYSGDLYEATGLWFGASPFALTAARKVGTMTVVAPTMTTATLSYTVDGVTVTKSIRRYTFRYEDYDGAYIGTHSVTWSKCNNPAEDGTRTVPTNYTMSLVGSVMTVVTTDSTKSCTYSGPYSQDGRLGRMDATYSCSNGEVGAMAFEEINIQRFALMGKLFGANNRGCHIEGSFAAVDQ